MADKLALTLKASFDEAIDAYTKDRLGALPSYDQNQIDKLLTFVRDDISEDEEFPKGFEWLLLWVMSITSALRAGFTPSEYFYSQYKLYEITFCKLGFKIEEELNIANADISGWLPLDFDPEIFKWQKENDKEEKFFTTFSSLPEQVFWSGCLNYYNMNNKKKAGELFGECWSLLDNKRMRLSALQKKAWCAVHCQEWDEAIACYEKIKELAKLPDTKERASVCIGFIRAMREFGVDEEDIEYPFAVAPAEFASVLQEVDNILEQHIGTYRKENSSPSTLAALIEERKRLHSDLIENIYKVIGIEIFNKLPAESAELLINAEKLYQIQENPGQAIIDTYNSVAILLQYYFGNKLISLLHNNKKSPKIESLGIYQCAEIFENINHLDEISDKFLLKFGQLNNCISSTLVGRNVHELTTLASKLRELQQIRNLFGHPERVAQSGPPNWRDQLKNLDDIRKLVLMGNDNQTSILKNIIDIFT